MLSIVKWDAFDCLRKKFAASILLLFFRPVTEGSTSTLTSQECQRIEHPPQNISESGIDNPQAVEVDQELEPGISEGIRLVLNMP